jgi:hypothetical protein
MARAMLLFERQADASWLPTTVILATPERLLGKSCQGPGTATPGSPCSILGHLRTSFSSCGRWSSVCAS